MSVLGHYKIKIEKLNKLIKFTSTNNGLTLIEVIVVVAILGLLTAIAVPSFLGLIEQAKEQVCQTNRLLVERTYKYDLLVKNVEHSDELFEQHLQEFDEELCPDQGEFTYEGGKVQCSVHSVNDDGKDSNDESVPFL